MTGCFHSKMEQVMIDSYVENGLKYGKNRVFNNYSGHRPAEPSSLAAVATWHSLTHLQMAIIRNIRKECPYSRVIHPWEYDKYVTAIQRTYRRHIKYKKYKKSTDTTVRKTRKATNLSSFAIAKYPTK